MATIVAVRNGNWSDTSHVTGPWPGGSTPTTKPTAGDTVQTDSYTVTIDENIDVALLEATATGHFEVRAAGIAITANIIHSGTYATYGGLNVAHSSGTVTLTGTVTQNSATANAHAVVNNDSGALHIVGSVIGGIGNAQGVRNLADGVVTISGNATGGSAAGATAVTNNGAGSVSIAGNVLGGSTSNCIGVHNASTGEVTVAGNATGGDNSSAYGALNNSTGTLTINGIVSGGSALFAAGLRGSASGGLTRYRRAVIGDTPGTPTLGYVKLIPDAASRITVIRSDTGADLNLVAQPAGTIGGHVTRRI